VGASTGPVVGLHQLHAQPHHLQCPPQASLIMIVNNLSRKISCFKKDTFLTSDITSLKQKDIFFYPLTRKVLKPETVTLIFDVIIINVFV
jgi:hypothetical protein